MDNSIIAIIFQEFGRLLSGILRSQPPKRSQTESPLDIEDKILPIPEEMPRDEMNGTEAGTGCIPCSLGHLGTCSGLLNEAMRFARKDGITSNEVINRINACMDEISSLERIDLRPEKIVKLPKEEKDLANKALVESRDIRHGLEELSSVDDLERLAARTQTVRNAIGSEWFRGKLSKMPKEEKAKIADRVVKRLEEEA